MILDIIGLEKYGLYHSQTPEYENIVTVTYRESPPIVSLTVSLTVKMLGDAIPSTREK